MRSAMRLMPLLLACLMVGQAMAARHLQESWDPTKKQYVQIALTLSGKCSDVDAARLLRDNVVADVKAYFVGKKKQSVADTVKGRLDTVCQDIKEGSNNLAAFRTAVNFVGLDNTDDRSALFRAAKLNACTGGINFKVYAKLGAALKTAKYTTKYNQGGQWNPNSKRGPIAYVAADNCNPTPPTPSPSPAPVASPSPDPAASPSPAPASPSPAPASPSPAPLNCSALVPNSVNDGTGNCVCTGSGFTVSAYNGTTLAACLATSITTCPTAYPIAAKDSNGVIQLCLANINACPTQYPFMLVAGDSAAIVECRPAGSACTFTGFTVPINDAASGDVMGCVKNDGQCPSAYPVAYREQATSYQLQKCDNAASCPAWSATVSKFTTTARTASGKLVGCFTLGGYAVGVTSGTCPALTAVNFPTNVVGADPDPLGTVKTLSCLAPNSTCPSSNPIQLFAQTTAGAPPTVVSCALISVLVNGACPTAVLSAYPVSTGPFSVRIGPSDQVVGCSAALTVCPVAYPFPTFVPPSTNIASCSPTGSTTSCTGLSIPAVDVAGNTVACLGQVTTCPTNYPIEVRTSLGDLVECRAQGASCPATGSTFPYYQATAAGQPAILKQCRPKPGTDSCTFSTFLVSIYTNDTLTNANLVGCVSQDPATTKCPAAYPVAYQSGTAPFALVQCRPTTITACPTAASPAAINTFTTKVVDATGKIVACIALAAPTTCPANYPVAVKGVLAVTYAATNVIQCMPLGTTTCPADYSFALYDTTTSPGAATLVGCLPTQSSTSCGAPLAPFTGAPINSPSGSLTGCTSTANPAVCPATYIAFYTAGVITECRTGLLSTCKNTDPTHPVNGKTSTGAVVACIDNVPVCPLAYPVAVAPDTVTNPTDCLTQSSSCPLSAITAAGATYAPKFPLYQGPDTTQPAVVPKLVRCVSVATTISGAPQTVCATLANQYYGATFQVPVYSDAAGTTLAGCLFGPLPGPAAGSTTTPCPAGTVPLLPAAGVPIQECRPRTDCTFPATAGASGIIFQTYKTQIKSAAGVLKGCQEQVIATVCPPGGAGIILAELYSFPLLGPASSGSTTAVVAECRPALAAPALSCSATPYAASNPVNIGPAAAPIVACMTNGVACPTAAQLANYIFGTPVGGANPPAGQPTACVV